MDALPPIVLDILHNHTLIFCFLFRIFSWGSYRARMHVCLRIQPQLSPWPPMGTSISHMATFLVVRIVNGYMNTAHSVSWPKVVKDVRNQGVDCSVR